MEAFSLIMMVFAVIAYAGVQAADLKHPRKAQVQEHVFHYESLNPKEIEF